MELKGGWAVGWLLGYGTGVTRQVWWPSQGTGNPKPKALSFISPPPHPRPSHSCLLSPGLYSLWEVLYLQRGSTELTAQPGGGHGQWPGDHAGHPAGGVPAHLERDKYAGGKGTGAPAWVLCLGWVSKGPHLYRADETSFEAGIRVQIHSQEEPPYIHQLGFGVSPGFQTFVSCQEQRVSTSSWVLGQARGWAFGLRGNADQICPPEARIPPVLPWTLLGLWAPEGQVGRLCVTPSCPTSAADLSAPALGQLPSGEWAQGA